jgi:hypothetical protein
MTAYLATLTMLLASGPSQADGVVLRWNLKKDDGFYTKTTTKMDQSMLVNGNEVKQDLKQTVVHGYKVVSAGEDGYVLEQTIVDSKSEGNLAAGANDVAKKMKGTVFKYTFSKDFEVKQVDGVKEYIDKISDGNAVVKQLLQSSLNEEVLRTSMHEIFRIGSDKPIKKGDNWNKDFNFPLGALGDITSKLKYTLEDVKEGVAQVKSSGKGEYGTPKKGAGGGIVVTEAKVKIDKLETVMQFDLKAKRLKSAKTELTMVGPMTMSVNGREVSMELNAAHSSTVEVLEKNPIEN